MQALHMAQPRARVTVTTDPVRLTGTEAPTILIADDEPVIVELLALLLEDEGYTVMRAYDGEEAWRALCSRPPDLIISDISMPRLDGLGLLRRMRSTVLRNVPVILMSAHDRSVTAPRVTFVPKPFDLDRMVAFVRQALKPLPN